MGPVAQDYNPPMPLRAPELQIVMTRTVFRCQRNARFVAKEMPQGTPRITNSIENVKWFAAQFCLHVAQIHPNIAAQNPGAEKFTDDEAEL
jgi:hypothetical protein